MASRPFLCIFVLCVILVLCLAQNDAGTSNRRNRIRRKRGAGGDSSSSPKDARSNFHPLPTEQQKTNKQQPSASAHQQQQQQQQQQQPSTVSSIEAELSKKVEVSAELAAKMKENFDWRAYLEMYSDLVRAGIHTQVLAEQHYLIYGLNEGRAFPERIPQRGSLSPARQKLTNYVQLLETNKVAKEKRVMLTYHIDWPAFEDSQDMLRNNLLYFLDAVESDSQQPVPRAFYWFNVVGGSLNPFYSLLNSHLANVAVVEWAAAPSDMYLHLRTLSLEKATVQSHFHLLLFTSSEVRGPFIMRERGQWIDIFLSLLTKDVGLVGTTLSCAPSVHIQNHFFGLPSSLVDSLSNHYSSFRPYETGGDLARSYEIGLSHFVRNTMHKGLASTLYAYLAHDARFNGTCLKLPLSSPRNAPSSLFAAREEARPAASSRGAEGGAPDALAAQAAAAVADAHPHPLLHLAHGEGYSDASSLSLPPVGSSSPMLSSTHPLPRFVLHRNPSRWCEADVTGVVFLRYGGPAYRYQDFLCPRIQAQVSAALRYQAMARPGRGYVYPEALLGGGAWGDVHHAVAIDHARTWNGILHTDTTLERGEASYRTPPPAALSRSEDVWPAHMFWNTSKLYLSRRTVLAHSREWNPAQNRNPAQSTTASQAAAADLPPKVCLIVKCCSYDSAWDTTGTEPGREGLAAIYRRMYTEHYTRLSGRTDKSSATQDEGLRQFVQQTDLATFEDMFLIHRRPNFRQTLRTFMEAMYRQTSPHWRVFLLYGDAYSASVKKRVSSIFQRLGDKRVSDIPLPESLQFSRESNGDMEYKALLAAYQHVYAQADCAYVSLTALGAVPGSDVVRSVLQYTSAPSVKVVMAAVDSLRDKYDAALPPTTSSAASSAHCRVLVRLLRQQPNTFAAFPAQQSSLQNVLHPQFNSLYAYTHNYLFKALHPGTFNNFVYLHQNLELTSSLFLATPRANSTLRDLHFRMISAMLAPSPTPSVHRAHLSHLFRSAEVAKLSRESFHELIFMTGQSPLYCLAHQGTWLDHRHAFLSRCLPPTAVYSYFHYYPHSRSPGKAQQLNAQYHQQVRTGGNASTTARADKFYGLLYFDLLDKLTWADTGHKCVRLSEEGYRLFRPTMAEEV